MSEKRWAWQGVSGAVEEGTEGRNVGSISATMLAGQTRGASAVVEDIFAHWQCLGLASVSSELAMLPIPFFFTLSIVYPPVNSRHSF